jgi:hypothetical protein
MTPDDTPESVETQVERIRRHAGGLSDYRLDLAIAETQARRDVAAAHRLPGAAAMWNGLLIALADVRTVRTQTAREIEDLTGPPSPIVRALTAEELAEADFADEPMEPPC